MENQSQQLSLTCRSCNGSGRAKHTRTSKLGKVFTAEGPCRTCGGVGQRSATKVAAQVSLMKQALAGISEELFAGAIRELETAHERLTRST